MNKLQIELTEPEAQTLIQLIHVAVQVKGLDAAQAGVFFHQKISAAVEASKVSPALDKPVET